jgi:ribonuclease Y
MAEAKLGSAESEAKRIVAQAGQDAEAKKREVLLEAKEEVHKMRSESERELRERRNELNQHERRLINKEESLEKKTEQIEIRERLIRGCASQSLQHVGVLAARTGKACRHDRRRG